VAIILFQKKKRKKRKKKKEKERKRKKKIFFSVFLKEKMSPHLLLFISILVLQPILSERINIEDFGAIGDGETLNTKAIQAAILHCEEALSDQREGSRRGLEERERQEEDNSCHIVIPGKGKEFLTGPFNLTSHLILEIEEGGRMTFSADKSLYPVLPYKEHPSRPNWEEKEIYHPFMRAYNLTDVMLLGPGTIFGGGPQWKSSSPKRPYVLQALGSDNIRLRDLVFIDAPDWAFRPRMFFFYYSFFSFFLSDSWAQPLELV